MQLDLKITGWGPAHHPTSRRTELFADWIEAQALLSGAIASVGQGDLVDRLEGTSLIKDSDDAWTLVGDAFSACRQRRKYIGQGYPFSLAGRSIEWTNEGGLPYTLCLMASLPEQLQSLRTAYPLEFRDIFERVVAEAMVDALPGWRIYSTGWSTIAGDNGK